jgi:hypothetical protein
LFRGNGIFILKQTTPPGKALTLHTSEALLAAA